MPEKLLISKIAGAGHLPPRSFDAVIVGIGDDASVLRTPRNHELVVTTDFSLEGVHFRRDWHSPESVGHRCLTRGLSDIAAMGGEPVAAFLSLAVPSNLPQRWVDRFISGLLNLAGKFGVALAGGDTSRSPSGVLADIAVVGSVPRGKAVLRSGARPGDRIYVTELLGASAAALGLLYSGNKVTAKQVPSHFFPTARIRVAQVLRTKGIASAMIDVSDGLSTDLSHICEASSVGAKIWEDAIPRAVIGNPAQKVALKYALHGGDDYELLFTARKRTNVPAKIAGVRTTCIGEITGARKLSIINKAGVKRRLEVRGWEYFRKTSVK